jgi:hypothetical protein
MRDVQRNIFIISDGTPLVTGTGILVPLTWSVRTSKKNGERWEKMVKN